MPMLLVITGASRGLGKAIALEFCGLFKNNNNNNSNNSNSLETLDMILISRNEQMLKQAQFEIQQANANANVILCILDLGDLNDLEARVQAQIIDAMNKLQQKTHQYDHFVFINNAGSIGHIGPSIQTPSLRHIQQNVDLNVTSACWLSARMAKWAHEQQQQQQTTTTTTIVNISSLLAIQAFPSLALYSAGKAARDQYHVAMAKELSTATNSNTNTSSIRILNYAPGPLETDMTNEIRLAQDLDAQLKPQYQRKLIETRDSAARLVKLLVSQGSFESGQHVDYYDLNS